MSAPPATDNLPRHLSTPLHLACTEVWGGNRPIDAPIELPGIRGRIFSRPCDGGRGGDVHYLSVCGSGLIARMCLADVVGHGEAVATVSTAIHDLLRRYMNSFDHRHVLTKLNRRLASAGWSALTTAAVITHYPPARSLSVSYAGHPPVWLYRRGEDRWSCRSADPAAPVAEKAIDLPLGAVPETAFTRHRQRLAYGDRLLALTDGVLEAPNPAGDFFGVDRLAAVLNKHRREPLDALARATLDALYSHAGTARLSHDDVTLLVVEFVPGPPGPTLWHVVKNRLLRQRGNGDDPIFADPRAATPV
jgi:sigma-B regulation protein RsbU (phosphoserine phosphatase)